MKEDNTPTVTSRRRTPSVKMRLRLETAKRIRNVNSKYKGVRARKKEAKRNAGETDPEAQMSTTAIPRLKRNRLADPPKATSKFKRRQIHKSWLPTHLWHAKRAHMTKPSEPLWRMAIPLSPTEKSYRPSHRASGGRGTIAWDMSYMATIGCEGVEPSLIAMLKAIAFSDGNLWSVKGKKWMNGTRSATGWVYERDIEKRAIAPITILWESEFQTSGFDLPGCQLRESLGQKENAGVEKADVAAGSTKCKPKGRKLLLRVHPSAFHQLWTELVEVARLQRPPVVLEDLRFELASFALTGPGSAEALCAVLQPFTLSNAPMGCSAQTWTQLSGLTNSASLPPGAILGFNVADPRLLHPRKSIAIFRDESNNNELTDLIVGWPPDKPTAKADIFSHRARRAASIALLSQKAINRRRNLVSAGETLPPLASDPQIPVMVLASRPNTSASGAQGTWTVLLPWKCLDPIWRCLMYYPLSSGGTPMFGGLEQTRQIAFERNEPWFPADFPGTEAGKSWERTEAEKRFNVWNCKPPSRRTNYESLRLNSEAKGERGSGWACDWEFLLGLGVTDSDAASSGEDPHKSSSIPSIVTGTTTRTDTFEREESAAAPKDDRTSSSTTAFAQLSPIKASILLQPRPGTIPAPLSNTPCLATIRISLLTRGNPSSCARIYRLPFASSTGESSLRYKWLALDPRSNPTLTCSRMKKIKINWRGDTAVHTAYDDEHADINAIDHRPPDMVPEATAEVEKRRGNRRAKRERFQKQKLARKVKEDVPEVGGPEGEVGRAAEEREALMRELMTPSADKDKDRTDHAAALECPGQEDLIGFVTSGGYNLSVGRGTGIGAVWVQRVLEGWRGQGGKDKRQYGPGEVKRLEREMRLCVVRNAGESVGRLGIWEVCH